MYTLDSFPASTVPGSAIQASIETRSLLGRRPLDNVDSLPIKRPAAKLVVARQVLEGDFFSRSSRQ